MNLREAATLALEALENLCRSLSPESVLATSLNHRIATLRAALENEFDPDWDRVEALQESLREHMAEIHRLRTALEQQQAKPLTDEEIAKCMLSVDDPLLFGHFRGYETVIKQFARAIEAAHGIGEKHE